jgi:hypothetical protein
VDIQPVTKDKAFKPGRSPAVSGGSSFFGPQQGASSGGAMGNNISSNGFGNGCFSRLVFKIVYNLRRGFISSVNFIMTADIEQNNFALGDGNGQGDAIVVGDTDSLNSFKPAAKVMIGKMRRKRILGQIFNYLREAILEIRMFFQKFARTAHKMPRRNDGKHYASSSISRAFKRSLAEANR